MSEPTSPAPAARAATPELARLSDSDLGELDRLLTGAWPAPWVAHTFEIDCPCPNGEDCGDLHTCEQVEAPEAYPASAEEPAAPGDGQCVVQIAVPGLESLAGPNAAFIAAARNALPSLVAEVRAGRAEAGKLREERDASEAARGRLGGMYGSVLVERNEAREAAARLRERAQKVIDEIDALAAESNGVAGLHLNGDVADWAWLYDSWLSSLAALRAALRAESPPSGGHGPGCATFDASNGCDCGGPATPTPAGPAHRKNCRCWYCYDARRKAAGLPSKPPNGCGCGGACAECHEKESLMAGAEAKPPATTRERCPGCGWTAGHDRRCPIEGDDRAAPAPADPATLMSVEQQQAAEAARRVLRPIEESPAAAAVDDPDYFAAAPPADEET